MAWLIKEYAYLNVWNDEFSIRADGGPICAGEVPFSFKLWINILFTVVNIILFFKSHTEKLFIFPKKKIYLIEYFLGALCIGLLISQIYFKVMSRSLVFLLNPCHLLCVI